VNRRGTLHERISVDRLSSLWNGLDARRRIVALLAAAAAMLAVWGLARMATEPSLSLLYAGLDPAASGEVISALEARGIPYEARGDSIWAPEGQRDALRMALAADGLPQAGARGYELLDDLSGFGTTAQMFDAAYWRAKEGELARTILALPSVRQARVHIANPPRRPFEQAPTPSASVSVSVGSGALGEAQASAIRHLVSSAVPGLTAAQVTVVDAENGTVLTEEGGPESPQAVEDRAARLKANVERLLEARVGRGAAVVEVMVDADMNSETVTERVLDPQGRVAIHTDTQETSEQSQGGEAGGVTVASNLPDGGEEGAGGASSSSNETRERVNYEVSEVLRERIRRPGEVRKISVAVLVDGVRTVNDAGEVEWTPRPEQELQALRELVESAIGFDPARGDVVTLRTLEFTAPAELGTSASASGAADFLAANAMTLIQLGALSLVALLLGLFVLRPMVTRRIEDARTLELEALPDGDARTQAEAALALAGEVIDPGQITADRLRSLRDLTGERKDDAAALLGLWLEQGEPARETA
tara:strand:- start:99 stop:1703 length:1605 start_codon:yes stop_codon:yes gene_type:complete